MAQSHPKQRRTKLTFLDHVAQCLRLLYTDFPDRKGTSVSFRLAPSAEQHPSVGQGVLFIVPVHRGWCCLLISIASVIQSCNCLPSKGWKYCQRFRKRLSNCYGINNNSTRADVKIWSIIQVVLNSWVWYPLRTEAGRIILIILSPTLASLKSNFWSLLQSFILNMHNELEENPVTLKQKSSIMI